MNGSKGWTVAWPRTLAAGVALALAASVMASAPLPGASEGTSVTAATPRPRDCPKSLGRSRFRDGYQVEAQVGNLVDLLCNYVRKRGGGKPVQTRYIRLRYHIGQQLPRYDAAGSRTYCWQVPWVADSEETTASVAGRAPDELAAHGKSGIIYPIGDRFIQVLYGGSDKAGLKQARLAAVELARQLVGVDSIGVVACPGAEPPSTMMDLSEAEAAAAGQRFSVAVDRYTASRAEAFRLLETPIAPERPDEYAAIVVSSNLAYAQAAEGLARDLEELGLPPDLDDDVERLRTAALEEAALWMILVAEPIDPETGDYDLDIHAAAEDGLRGVGSRRDLALAALAEVLGVDAVSAG